MKAKLETVKELSLIIRQQQATIENLRKKISTDAKKHQRYKNALLAISLSCPIKNYNWWQLARQEYGMAIIGLYGYEIALRVEMKKQPRQLKTTFRQAMITMNKSVENAMPSAWQHTENKSYFSPSQYRPRGY